MNESIIPGGALRGKLNEILSSKRPFFADTINSRSLILALLLNIIHWTVLYSKIKLGEGDILLHYNVITGPDLIGKSLLAYLIPLFALILLIFNFILSAIFYRKEKLVSYFINIATIPVQLIFFVASIVLISING